jgi:hypothetical protein
MTTRYGFRRTFGRIGHVEKMHSGCRAFEEQKKRNVWWDQEEGYQVLICGLWASASSVLLRAVWKHNRLDGGGWPGGGEPMDNSTRNGGFSGGDCDLWVDYGGRFTIFSP